MNVCSIFNSVCQKQNQQGKKIRLKKGREESDELQKMLFS